MRRAILLFTLCLLAVSHAPLYADEAPRARAYLDQINECLTLIEAQMPAITRAAELSAEAIDAGRGNRGFGVRGDAGLANELSNRAGALMGYDGRAGDSGDVIVYVFGLPGAEQRDVRALLVRQFDEADRLKAAGSVVIGIGSAEQIKRFGLQDLTEQTCTAFLNNAAPAHDDLPQDELGRTAVPMATVLNAAVAWAYQCELFAACTRLDRVPVVRQSFEIDTRRRRWLRYGSQRFHHDRWLDPISPGRLGLDYLVGLRDVLRDIGTASWRDLARTAHRAERTLSVGGTVWLRAGGRYLPYHVGGRLISDPGLFTALNHDGSDPRLAVPGKNDFVIAVGLSETAGSHEWGEPELLRQAGRGVSWVVNGHNTQPGDLMRDEVLIDLWAPYGDGVVRVKDYDTPLGPVSGVVSEAVTWMIAAEVYDARIK